MSPAARLVIVGPGRVGQSLAAGLATAGKQVEIRGTSSRIPDLVAGRSGVVCLEGLPDDGPLPRTLVFAVPDDALASAVRGWAGALGASEGGGPDGEDGSSPASRGLPPDEGGVGSRSVALHTSGVDDAGVLGPLRELGMAAGTWHPLVSVAAPSANAFRGVTFGVSGDEAAVERAGELTARLGGRTVEVEPGASVRYHAAAVFASNCLAACLAVAAEELGAATGGRAGLGDLAPLARAAVENVLERGLPDGVTGPVQRGDVGSVRRHLEVLGPERRRLYRELARELLAVVEDGLPAGRARELRELLGPDDS